jgi:hypothetical protein
VILGFIFIWLYEYLVHGQLLTDLYAQTRQLWRSDADMADKFPVLMFVQFVTSMMTMFIFTRFYKTQSVAEGLGYGAIIGVLLGIITASQYVWLPVSATLGLAWFGSDLIEGLGLGMIFALTYRH